MTSNVIPFWQKNCPDTEFGAYFTCLDRDGIVYSTEKFMWMQRRIVWMSSEFFCKLEPNDNWLRLAKNGYDFLTKHGKGPMGRYYFSLQADHVPLLNLF
jgi:N-acylglucosamine 2-epimerase